MSRLPNALLLASLVAAPGLVMAQTSTLAPAGSPGVTPTLQLPTPGSTTAPATVPATKTPSAAQAAQRDRMTSCNATATDRNFKGGARSSFMKACLAGQTDPKTMMRVCNGQATQDKLSADARKSYMSTCLKAPG